MTNNLEGQTALVTGATSGTGCAIALRLGRDGAEVVVHGRDHTCGQEVLNNAGFSWFGPTHYLDAETFHAMFASNVRSAYLLVAAPAPKMAARGTGSIVNLSGMAAQVGLVGVAAYSATKASLEEMTRSWAAESALAARASIRSRPARCSPPERHPSSARRRS
jgi:NAD(P)-dependent dehydrogenase (short-subunit alcohol dehydrogenase family)